jgi:hypothetical protein
MKLNYQEHCDLTLKLYFVTQYGIIKANVCLSVCMFEINSLTPSTDSNQIWCSNHSEPGGKHRLHKNPFSLTP